MTDGADSSERDSERHTHNTTHKKGKLNILINHTFC